MSGSRRDRSPNNFSTKADNRRIIGYNRDIIDQRLRRQNTVKRVFVRTVQSAGQTPMFYRDRERLEVMSLEIAAEVFTQRPGGARPPLVSAGRQRPWCR